MLRLPDPSLVVLIGASAAGKSMWAQEHFRPEQVVSSDRLRAVVGENEHDLAASADAFAVLEQIVAARVGRRLTTVIDTLGLDPDRRRGWRALAARHGVHTVAVTFTVPAAECRRRNSLRERKIPASVLTGQLKQFARVQAELAAEGFDEIIAPEPVRVVPAAFAEAARSVGAAEPDAGDPRSSVPGTAVAPRFGLQLSSFAVPGGPAGLADRLA